MNNIVCNAQFVTHVPYLHADPKYPNTKIDSSQIIEQRFITLTPSSLVHIPCSIFDLSFEKTNKYSKNASLICVWMDACVTGNLRNSISSETSRCFFWKFKDKCRIIGNVRWAKAMWLNSSRRALVVVESINFSMGGCLGNCAIINFLTTSFYSLLEHKRILMRRHLCKSSIYNRDVFVKMASPPRTLIFVTQ